MSEAPPDTCHRLGHDAYLDATAAEIALMAEVIAKGDPAATVVTCPEWTLAKLVRHVARVHRWCAALVRTKSTESSIRGRCR